MQQVAVFSSTLRSWASSVMFLFLINMFCYIFHFGEFLFLLGRSWTVSLNLSFLCFYVAQECKADQSKVVMEPRSLPQQPRVVVGDDGSRRVAGVPESS